MRRLVVIARWAAAGALALAAGCSGCGDEGGGSSLSAVADGASVEAARDATPAPHEAGSDASPDALEAATKDAAIPPKWTGWEIVSDAADCTIYRPIDVPASVAPITWSPCSGPSGCTQLDIPWWDGSHAAVRGGIMHKDEGRAFLFLEELHGTDVDIAGIFDLENGGAPIAAWGADHMHLCLGPTSFAKQRIVTTTMRDLPDQQDLEDTLYLSSVDSIAHATPFMTLATNSPGFGISQKAALGDHLIAYEMLYRPIVVLDTGTMTWKSVPVAGGAEAVDPRVHGDDVFFTALDSGGDDLWVRRADGSLDKLRDVPSTHVVGFATDGTTLAWLQLSQPSNTDPTGYDHVELWTAPYTTSAAALAPKKLTTIPGPGWEAVTLMAHASHAAYYANDPRVYRLSDGAYYTPPPPPIAGLTYRQVIWVDDTELVLLLSDGVRGRTIVRMKLADMTLHPAAP